MRATRKASETPIRVPIPTWGPRFQTNHGLLAHNRSGPNELAHLLTGHLIICTFTPCKNQETRLAGSRIRTADVFPGSIEIVPAGADYWARWQCRKQVALFVMESVWLRRLALQSFDKANFELEHDGLPFVSARLRQMAYMFKTDILQLPQTGLALYTDSFLTLLGTEIIQNHSTFPVGARYKQDRMPRRLLHQLVEYMRAELGNEITLDKLAGVAGYSPDRLLRAFKAETGFSPHKFLMNLRLDLAQDLLENTRLTISEIANRVGFSSQAHLTSAMSKERRVTPGRIRSSRSTSV